MNFSAKTASSASPTALPPRVAVTAAAAAAATFSDDAENNEDYLSLPSSNHNRDEDDEDDGESLDELIARYTRGMRYYDDTSGNDGDEDDDIQNGRTIVSKPIVRIKQPQLEAPEFMQRLRGYNEVLVGESVSFVATFRAFPAPSFKWFKDEEEVRATERHLLESLITDYEGDLRLTINDVRGTDEGAYKCKVENHEGVASTTGYLTVSGVDKRSRQRARTTSSRNSNKLSVTSPSPSRSPGVSSPPLLRSIVEQASIEETEERELSRQPPSPLQDFIDTIRHSAKSRHPPIFYGMEYDLYKFDDDDSNKVDDVFDGNDDAVCQSTSSDNVELLLTPTTSSEDDAEDCTSSSQSTETSCVASDEDDIVLTASAAANFKLGQSATEIRDIENRCMEPDDVLRLSATPLGAVPKPSSLTTAAAAMDFPSDLVSRLQHHFLSVDDCSHADLSSAVETSPNGRPDSSSHDHNGTVSVTDCSAARCSSILTANPIASGYRPITTRPTSVKDTVLDLLDNSLFRFLTAFVTVTAALASAFDIQPGLLTLVVTIVSFISFTFFEHRSTQQYTVTCQSTFYHTTS